MQLRVWSWKLFNHKYIIALMQVAKTEIFAFVAVLVFKLLSRKAETSITKLDGFY